ncbi:MAG TPA: RNA polymerase sigma factor [Acidimicrobiia bacterium]|jgi:RNA polymerase sigma-70 factor (ECF subfamily)
MAFGEQFDDVLEAARAGAEWAWSILYDELSPKLHGYLRVRGAVDAENLVGEVFLQVARNIETFDGTERNFHSWVFMVAHSRLIDERRARTRRPEQLVETEKLTGVVSADDTERAALDRIDDGLLRTLFSELTPDQRDVLMLRIIGGLTLEETSRALGKRIGAITALQRRALGAIRRKLDNEGVAR